MHKDSLLHVDLAAIGRNARSLVAMVGPRATCCGIVKADAYGIGARRVAETLLEAGMTRLAVFRVDEAIDLLGAGPPVPIVLLAPIRSLSPVHPLAPAVQRGDVELVLHDDRQMDDLLALARLGSTRVSVHVEIDTGMCRGGMKPEAARPLISRILRSPLLRLRGVMTHFSEAGRDAAATRKQHGLFRSVVESLGPLPASCQVHAAATAAAVRDPAYHWDCVRIGLGWCGCVPGDEALANRLERPLTPALAWRSSICHAHEVPAGTSVGYGGVWTAPQDTVIGIVPVGYADGIPPAAGATDQRCGASIRVHPPQSVASGEGRGAAAAIVGAVSMDQIAVDLGALRGRADSFVGRGVEIIETAHNGPHSLRGFAQACGLTPHQLLVGIGPRVPRVSVSRPLVEQPSEAWQAAAV